MKILITGSEGFLGKNLVNYFNNSRDVTTLDIAGKPNVKADLTKTPKLVAKFDVVINLAALSNVYVPPEDVGRIIDHNLSSFENAVAIAKHSGAGLVIQASSSSVYGGCAAPYSESSVCKPLGAYGDSKLACENASARLEEDTGVKIVNLRLHNLIGEYQKASMLPHLVFKAIEGKHNLELFGITKRSWTPVEDLCSLLDQIFNIPFNQLSDLYNVGSESAVSQLDIIKIAETITGKKCPYNLVAKRDFEMDLTLPDMTHFKNTFGQVTRTNSDFLFDSMENVYRTYV